MSYTCIQLVGVSTSAFMALIEVAIAVGLVGFTTLVDIFASREASTAVSAICIACVALGYLTTICGILLMLQNNDPRVVFKAKSGYIFTSVLYAELWAILFGLAMVVIPLCRLNFNLLLFFRRSPRDQALFTPVFRRHVPERVYLFHWASLVGLILGVVITCCVFYPYIVLFLFCLFVLFIMSMIGAMGTTVVIFGVSIVYWAIPDCLRPDCPVIKKYFTPNPSAEAMETMNAFFHRKGVRFVLLVVILYLVFLLTMLLGPAFAGPSPFSELCYSMSAGYLLPEVVVLIAAFVGWVVWILQALDIDFGVINNAQPPSQVEAQRPNRQVWQQPVGLESSVFASEAYTGSAYRDPAGPAVVQISSKGPLESFTG